MNNIYSTEHYLTQVCDPVLKCRLEQFSVLHDYFQRLTLELHQHIAKISVNNFWEQLPLIMGIDSKLFLLTHLTANYNELNYSEDEIIRMIERDYLTNNHELCGYFLNKKPHPSLLFYIR